MIDIDNLTLAQVRALAPLLAPFLSPSVAPDPVPYPFAVGDIVCVHTVTGWYVGVLDGVTATDLVLKNAAWVADSGRFSDFCATGEAKEIEPFPTHSRIAIGRGAIILVAKHPRQLREVK